LHLADPDAATDMGGSDTTTLELTESGGDSEPGDLTVSRRLEEARRLEGGFS
jgi:hypothetical protein